jgi:hypothetical protein
MVEAPPPPLKRRQWAEGALAKAERKLQQLRRTGKGAVPRNQTCEAATAGVNEGVDKLEGGLRALKELQCLSCIADFVGVPLVAPILRARLAHRNASVRREWQVPALVTTSYLGGKGVNSAYIMP